MDSFPQAMVLTFLDRIFELASHTLHMPWRNVYELLRKVVAFEISILIIDITDRASVRKVV